jgi:3-oxoacyl-[acyl-carrier protein] reductase
MEIGGKTFLVTGGAQGMGRCFTLELARLGANVLFCDLNTEKIAEVEAASTDLAGTVHGMELNIAESDRVVDGEIEYGIDRSEANFKTFLNKAVELFGDIHGIINNAGIIRDGMLAKIDRRTGKVKSLSNSKWKQVIDVNLTGVFLGSRAYAEWHIANEKKEGVIISVSSISRHGNQGQTNYSAAKAGLVAMTALWAGELGRYGIRTGAVAPGFTKTPILEGMPEEMLQKLVKPVPLRRIADPEEVFKAIRFMIECDYHTGRVIDVDGGLRLP